MRFLVILAAKTAIAVARVFVVSLATVAFVSAEEPKDTPKMRLWVPAYYYPFGKGLQQWDRLLASAKQVPIVAIVNPDSGPGMKPDTNYTTVIARGRRGG